MAADGRVRRNARDAGDARTARPQPGSCLPMVPADAGFFFCPGPRGGNGRRPDLVTFFSPHFLCLLGALLTRPRADLTLAG